MNRIELMKHRIGLLLKLNVFQFIKYNFFKKMFIVQKEHILCRSDREKYF